MRRVSLGGCHVLGGVAAVIISLGVWQGSSALAASTSSPTPNPVVPVPGLDVTGAGPASAIHGNPTSGAAKFATYCSSCHGDRGTTGIANPGSTDGTVPTINPIDPAFLNAAGGDPSVVAHELDAFLQHGSRPSGPQPQLSMPGFGDHNLVPQSDLADIEAYVMQLNGVFWPDRCPGIRLDIANPAVGARVEPGHLIVQGQAQDIRAQQGSGIDRIDLFLDSRASGGHGLASLNPTQAPAPSGPNTFQAKVLLPKLTGGHDLVVYAHSTVTNQEAMVTIPIAIGQDPSKAFVTAPTGALVTCTP